MKTRKTERAAITARSARGLSSWVVRGIALAGIAIVPSCSSAFHSKSCATDVDCGGTLVCVVDNAESICKAAADAPIRIGMSAPISGPSQDLGTEMRKGVVLAFDEQNAAGGVRGRRLELDFRDDQYQADAAEAAARDLLDVTPRDNMPARCPTTTVPVVSGASPVSTGALFRGGNAVVGLLGNVGTPTMVRSAPVAVETGSLFFGAFTGASKVLRDGMAGPCSKYIFNVRASYAQEAHATVKYFFKLGVPDARHVISFDQNDTFGQAGYDGLIAAYKAERTTIDPPYSADSPIARFRYTRDDETSVPAQITAVAKYIGQILTSDNAKHTVGIFMTDTYGPATAFIRGIRDWQYANDAEQQATQKATRLTLSFSNVSFVGPNSLGGRLKDAGTVTTPTGPKPYTDGVIVSQVVPNYSTDNNDTVRQYKKSLTAAGLDPSFTSLEGYLATRVFIAGLVANTGAFTPESLISTFEHLPALNLGLGASAAFTPDNHNYSKSIFGTAITPDGGFSDLYFWSDGNDIQLFE